MANAFASALALVLCAAPLAAQSDSQPRLRVLFIGNSYTYFHDLPRTLQTMAAMSGQASIEVATVLEGGATLKRHWTDGKAVQAIRKGSWNYIVLQDQSQTPATLPDTTLRYGKLFGDEIAAVKAKPVLYVTWHRKGRPAMQDSLTRTYTALGQQIGAILAHAGPAWAALQQSQPGLELYWADGSHPGPTGSYLAAVAIYHALFGQLPSASANIAWSSTPSLSAPWETIAPIRVSADVVRAVHRAVLCASNPSCK